MQKRQKFEIMYKNPFSEKQMRLLFTIFTICYFGIVIHNKSKAQRKKRNKKNPKEVENLQQQKISINKNRMGFPVKQKNGNKRKSGIKICAVIRNKKL